MNPPSPPDTLPSPHQPLVPRREVLEHHACSPTKALQHLRDVCGQELYFRVLSQILALALFQSFSAADVQPFTEYNAVTYGLSEAVAWGLWGSATRLARFYHCAAHGLALNSHAFQFIPAHLPIAALLEIGLPMPCLSLVLSYPHNPFLLHRFLTPLAAIAAAEAFCRWVDYHVLWLAECILRSARRGLSTEWNFGAVLGMRKAECLALITAVGADLEPHNYLEALDGRLFQYHGLDMEIVRLIRPWFTHAGVLQGPTQIGAALFPVEHSLAGPMDAVMSHGFIKMEEDSETVRERRETTRSHSLTTVN